MTTYAMLTDYLEKALKAKRPTEFKKLLKIQSELLQNEIDLEKAKNTINENILEINYYKRELKRVKDNNKKLAIDLAKRIDL